MTGSTDGIREVVARYAFALDSRDHAALAALHTADADWSFIVASEEVGHVRGRDAILAFASAPAAGQPVQQRHVLTNLVVEPGTSAATKQVVGYLALYTTPGLRR